MLSGPKFNLDTIGVGASALCLVHCLAFPILIATVPMLGGSTDESVIEAAKPDVERAAGVLDGYLSGSEFLAGDAATLADFFALPVLFYLSQIPEGQAVLSSSGSLSAWLERMNARASATATVPQLG